MANSKKQFLIIAAIAALISTAYLSWTAGANYGDTKLRDKVNEQASICHAMREMGITALAIKLNLNGIYFPSQECTKFYAILGVKEPPLTGEAKRIEDEMLAKAAKREAEVKKLDDEGKFEWR